MQQVQLAKQAYARRDYARAVEMCEQLAVRTGPRDDLLNIKAVSLLALGRIEAAEAAMRQALSFNPSVAGMQLNAAGIYLQLHDHKQVDKHVTNAIRLAPRDVAVLYQAAFLCRSCGNHSRSLRIVERCLQIKPGFAPAWHLKGSALIDLGKIEAAQEALEKAVKQEPGHARAWSALVKIRGDGLSDAGTVTTLKQVQTTGASLTDRACAGFTLADMHHRDGQYDKAFELYLEANALIASGQPFDLAGWEREKNAVIKASEGTGKPTPPLAVGGEKQVFIIGMPRSGTTLCEQVLSAHSGVFACGEVGAMEHIEKSLARKGLDPFRLPAAEQDMARALYLSSLPSAHRKYQRVTDKAPMNFERVGLIHRMFPRARFLYCVRHPLDTILSCFMQNFQAGMQFAFDLEHIARVYVVHVRMMHHWMKLLPEQIHVIDYEKYVANQEAETRAMAEFLGLGFEQEMMTPHLKERTVVTASRMQVRRAVYSSSIGRWKKYRSHLSPVAAMLQEEELLDSELNSLL